MKIKDLIIIGVAALLATITPLKAAPVLLAGSLVTVNNLTSNTPPIVALSFPVNSQLITVNHGALTATNAFFIQGRFTLDQTNYYISPQIWYPSFTNPGTEYIQATYFTFTPYFGLSVTSTNSIQYGANYGQ